MTQFQSTVLKQICPSCSSTKTNLVLMPNYSLHYAACRCRECDHFLGWEPKPENQQRQQQRQIRIAALLKSSGLSQWEREFLTSVQSKQSLSPRQQEVMNQIKAKVGGQG